MDDAHRPYAQIADVDYPIIDADAHVNEPPDLWQARVPARLRERAPRVVRAETGDVWSFDGGVRTWPLGLTACAGDSYPRYAAATHYDRIRPGSFDPKSRLGDMDIDGVHAVVLFPSVALTGAKTYADDREMQTACVRAYNEWLAEFCSADPTRLFGIGVIPTTGIDDAVAELEASIAMGHRGVVISRYPNGDFLPDASDDRFWEIAAATDLAVGVHIGSFLPSNPAQVWPDSSSMQIVSVSSLAKAGTESMPVACNLICTGLFERFPTLKVVLVEANIGWIPILLEQMDDTWERLRFVSGDAQFLSRMPSEVFHRNLWSTFMHDTAGVDMRHRMNLRHICWSTDYPHAGTDWPNSRKNIERLFRGVPCDEVKLMLHSNAKALYGLDEVPDELG
jgi:predicted TIM-barrel fold metal-dependent hydrolase